MKKEVKKCHLCGNKLKKVKTELMARAELSHTEDPYDGSYKPIYFYVCECWGRKNNLN